MANAVELFLRKTMRSDEVPSTSYARLGNSRPFIASNSSNSGAFPLLTNRREP